MISSWKFAEETKFALFGLLVLIPSGKTWFHWTDNRILSQSERIILRAPTCRPRHLFTWLNESLSHVVQQHHSVVGILLGPVNSALNFFPTAWWCPLAVSQSKHDCGMMLGGHIKWGLYMIGCRLQYSMWHGINFQQQLVCHQYGWEAIQPWRDEVNLSWMTPSEQLWEGYGNQQL